MVEREHRREVLGIPFDEIRMSQLLEYVNNQLRQNNRFRIAFSNPEFVVEARSNPGLLKYLRDCTFNVADGVGVLWAHNLLHGHKLPERVTGTDFVPRLCEMARNNGYKIFLLGGKKGVPEKARHAFQSMFPGLEIVGTMHGYFNNSEEVIAQINNSGADILMVCLGNPRQEEWISVHFDRLGVKMVFGNGGALDFWSGEVRRAPCWVREINLEWLYRLWQDRSIKRLKRQLRLFKFVSLVIAEKLRTVRV
jgi:N-acetylglucosaminyldiphosphoundecaprenol N-acetyl-beta-D-mannosaminyltransferase